MTTERLTAADGPQGDDWASIPAAPVQPAEDAAARASRQQFSAEVLDLATHDLASAMTAYDRHLASAMERHTDDMDYAALAETVAWLQGMKARLGQAEAYVARELGRMDSTPEVIELPDGRTAQVLKGKDRKEWRHDDWKRDVRQAVLGSASDFQWVEGVNTTTGETVDLAELVGHMLAQVQAVHGSAAPKVTALKPLGLSADDYCTSYPGPYSVRISTPTDTTTEG